MSSVKVSKRTRRIRKKNEIIEPEAPPLPKETLTEKAVDTDKNDNKSPMIVVAGKPRSGTSIMMDVMQMIGYELGPVKSGNPTLGIRGGRKELLNQFTHYVIGQQPPNVSAIQFFKDHNIQSIKLCRNMTDWISFLKEYYKVKLILIRRNEEDRIESAKNVGNPDLAYPETTKMPNPECYSDIDYIDIVFEKFVAKDEKTLKDLLNLLDSPGEHVLLKLKNLLKPDIVRFRDSLDQITEEDFYNNI